MRKGLKERGLTLVVCGCLTIGVIPCATQDRDAWQQPERVMDAIGITQGMTIGEIGAGAGYFTLRFAHRVGAHGKIYANDIRPQSLEAIRNRCDSEAVTNVETVLGTVDDPRFPEGAIDLAFMSFVFHMLEKPVELLEHLKPSLKHGAALVILEFKPDRIRSGPYPDNERVVELAAEAGYRLVRTESFIDRADIYVFTVEH